MNIKLIEEKQKYKVVCQQKDCLFVPPLDSITVECVHIMDNNRLVFGKTYLGAEYILFHYNNNDYIFHIIFSDCDSKEILQNSFEYNGIEYPAITPIFEFFAQKDEFLLRLYRKSDCKEYIMAMSTLHCKRQYYLGVKLDCKIIKL
jgi:hypothetical protein